MLNQCSFSEVSYTDYAVLSSLRDYISVALSLFVFARTSYRPSAAHFFFSGDVNVVIFSRILSCTPIDRSPCLKRRGRRFFISIFLFSFFLSLESWRVPHWLCIFSFWRRERRHLH